MIIGQTVFGGTYLSPWFPRRGDGAVFTAEVINKASGGTLIFGIQTKNTEEVDLAISAGSSGTLGTSNAIVGTVLGTLSVTGMKELVRFFYLVSGAAGDWVHFRVLPPAWRTNGA